jgi:type IV secretory pathway VirB2 component (pilin)
MKAVGLAFLVAIAACCLLGLAALTGWPEALSWVIVGAGVVALVLPLIPKKKGPRERA